MTAPQSDPQMLAASEAIISDHYNNARGEANRDMVYAVYTNGTRHTEAIDPAAQIVEDVLREGIIAKAKFHQEQVDRFAEALDKLRRFNPEGDAS